MKLAVDPLFTNSSRKINEMKSNSLFGNKFELIFDELIEGSLFNKPYFPISSSDDEDEDDYWIN